MIVRSELTLAKIHAIKGRQNILYQALYGSVAAIYTFSFFGLNCDFLYSFPFLRTVLLYTTEHELEFATYMSFLLPKILFPEISHGAASVIIVSSHHELHLAGKNNC